MYFPYARVGECWAGSAAHIECVCVYMVAFNIDGIDDVHEGNRLGTPDVL